MEYSGISLHSEGKEWQRKALSRNGEALLRKETQRQRSGQYEEQWLGKVPSRSATAFVLKSKQFEQLE